MIDSSAEDEKETLNKIFHDFKFLFGLEEIPVEEIDNVLRKLESEEAKQYIESLRMGSKSESALREAFLAGGSVLSKYLSSGSGVSPEVNLDEKRGFVDYIVKGEANRSVLLELKSLFEGDFEPTKSGRRLKRLRQRELDWKEHTDQIVKYIRKESEFIILTNLKEWFFFSKTCRPGECEPFLSLDLFQFYKEYNRVRNLWKYLERNEFQSIREELDKRFFESLDKWVKRLSEINFKPTVEEYKKIELVISLINKFIFIQTLDDYWVVDFRWIMRTWEHVEQRWQRKGKLRVLQEFFREVDTWFYEYYDTELFKENILQYVDEDERNVNLFYGNLQLVLGLVYWQTALGGFRGILQFNFKYIDEDILGKAYEKYLAEVRKEEGIYYTPKYITEYIVENTIGKMFDDLLSKIRKKIAEGKIDETKELMQKFISIKILDLACGSGSFLIKAIRTIWEKYQILKKIVGKEEKKYAQYNKTLVLPESAQEKLDMISEVKEILNAEDNRALISRLIIRHIHGVDLDRKALEVAKLNIWLEAIKLAPGEFMYGRLPKDISHILPNLKTNLGNGDSLVGLPEDLTIEYLQKNHKDEISKLFKLRKEYLDDPSKTNLVDEISRIKQDIRNGLDERFRKYLGENKLPLEIQKKTNSFHWALDFWYIFFDGDGTALARNNVGFDAVVGNPPYFTEVRGYKEKFRIYKNSPTVGKYYEQKMDVFCFFIERGLDILKNDGHLGYIIMEYWKSRTFGGKLREKIVNESILIKTIDFNEFKVFEEAPGQHNSIIILKKTKNGIKSGYKVYMVSVLNPDISINEMKNALFNKTVTKNILFKEAILKYVEENKAIMLEERGTSELLEKISKKQNYQIPKKNITQGLVTPQDYAIESHIKTLIEREIKPQFIEGEGIFVISEDEKSKMPLTPKEKELIKPFYYAHQIDSYYFDDKNEKWILYITKPYIEYDKNDIAKIARENNIGKEKAEKIIIAQTRIEYPSITKHLDRFQEIMTSDKKPYGLHRPRDEKVFKTKNKIISIRKTEHPKFVHIPIASYMNQSVNYITIDDSDLILYLLALLNSNLTRYYSKSLKSHGGQLQIDKEVIARYPIYIPLSKQQQKPFYNLVGRIYNYKKSHYNILKLWKYWAKNMEDTEYSLNKILLDDISIMKNGKSSKTWTVKATFYPDGDNDILNKEFKKIKIVGDTKKPVIKICGLNENNVEEIIYEMEFNNRDLMLIIYHSITDLFNSGKRVKTLSSFFSKTEVPVIQPDAKSKTPNILKKVNEEFRKWLKDEGIKEKIEPDIAKIDNEIKDVYAHIDALVFKLYELEEDEINTVMKSLNTPPSYTQKVLRYFREG